MKLKTRARGGLGTYKLTFADPRAGQAGFLGTIGENDRPVILDLCLKIERRCPPQIRRSKW